jgi:superfamily II DNA or RNA helicase
MSVRAVTDAIKTVKVSRLHKPRNMGLHQWQVALRRQFARELPLELRNLGKDSVFSEFAVFNPATKRTYRVAIRGDAPGMNFCSCPDYATNTLGTCKHVEHTLYKLRHRHAAKLRQGFRPPFAEVYLRYGAQRTIVFSPGTDCPPELERLAKQYFRLDGSLGAEAAGRFHEFVQAATASGHPVRIYDDALAFIAEQRDAVARCRRLEQRYMGRGANSAWKHLLKAPLYPYQREGALFAAQAGRALIADDMGLGKTIQAIAAAEILARECGAERALIVCPASLKYQWLSEIGQFSNRSALVIEGQTHARRALYTPREAFFKIVNYDVVHRDLEAMAAWRPDLVILDEAQRIKNWQTRAARTVKQIDARFAIVLTGTPLENRLEELHSIVEFVDRHRLGPLFAFKDAHAVYEPETTKVVGYRDLNKISQTLAPILIRRTKDEVLKQLPPRLDKNFFVPMTQQQWVPHNENKEIVARIVAKWNRFKFLSEADQLRLRVALQYMRMSCDSTYLVDHETRHGVKVDELCKLLEEVFEDPAAKVVIFSQWLRMNELVAEMLDDRRWGHVQLHGGVPSKERKDLIRALREEPDCRVFLSSDAGGVGLNLQAACTIINMDLPWNPAVLEQRIGRVHRLGQTRPVRVVNFISEGTIEHGMLSLLKFKRSVFTGVLDGASDQVYMGESALNRFMKTVETASASVPATAADDGEPDEVSESLGSDTNGAALLEARPDAASPLAIDMSALGNVLSRGAQLLETLGRSLVEPGFGRGNGARPAFAPRIEVDPSTGRRELRIALPDERVLQQWISQLAGALRG